MTDCEKCWWYGQPIDCPADFNIDTKICKNFRPKGEQNKMFVCDKCKKPIKHNGDNVEESVITIKGNSKSFDLCISCFALLKEHRDKLFIEFFGEGDE